MYQLPPKIVEALRRNGPSILEGATANGHHDTTPAVAVEPMREAEPVAAAVGAEPVTVSPEAAIATSADSKPARFISVTRKPDARNIGRSTESVELSTSNSHNSGEHNHPLPYRVLQSLAKSSFNRIDISITRKEPRPVRSTEPSAEPASVADINDNAMVNASTTEAQGPAGERYRPLPFRVVKALGEKATFHSIGVKETLKSIWRQEGKFPKMAFAIGAVSVAAVFAGEKAMTISENSDGITVMQTSSGDVYHPVSQKPIKSFSMGGNGQVVGPIHEVDMKGYAPGSRDEALEWDADMGIGNGRSSEHSIEQGSAVSMAKYREAQARGEHANFSYYSFGTYAGQDFAWDVYRQNGNKWPDDLTIDLIGGPQTAEGIGRSPFGKVGMGLIGLRNDEGDRALPPGAKVRMFYNDRDPYASGGNESALSLLYSIAGIGNGTHEVPDRNDPNVTWTMYKDANGIEHWVAHRKNEWVIDAIERSGIKIMDTHSANEAIRALFPRNDNPNAPPPEADVRLALTLGARALDRQIDPTGNTKIFETIVENMPEPWKQLMNDSWNGINHIADAVARAAADPSPQNIQHAFNTVMSEIGKIMGGVNQSLNGKPVDQNIKEWTVGSITQIVKDTSRQYAGQEIDIEPQLNQFADVMMATAKAWADERLATAQNNQTLGQQGSPLDIVPQVINQLPQNNPLITVNTPEAPVAPNVQAQGPAPAAELMPESSRIGILPDLPTPEAIVPNLPSIVSGPAPAPSTPAEITPPPANVVPDAPSSTWTPEPVWTPPAPVYVEPEPQWTPPTPPPPVYVAPAPVYEAPAPLPPPPPVFEAPAPPPPPPPAPAFQMPQFNMPSFDKGNIFGGAPSAPAFAPPPVASVPDVSNGMVLEPVG